MEISGIWLTRSSFQHLSRRTQPSPDFSHLRPLRARMFFTQKSKGYFIDVNDHAVMLARTSTSHAPFVIEEVMECAPGDAGAFKEAVTQLQGKKTSGVYAQAKVGIYPKKGVIRRHALELKRLKEPDYLGEVLSQQLRIERDKFIVHIINVTDGGDYDLAKSALKEALFCGMPVADLNTAQDALLEAGVYPTAIELGSVSTLGALTHHLASLKSKTPTLVLEIGVEATQSFIISSTGVEASRPIPHGLDSMVPVVQKELGLKDEEAARRLFYSNTFDFTGMGPLLVKRLLKELQSSIGFYEVQTGQSVGQILCTQLSPKLAWLETAIATSLGLGTMSLDHLAWLKAHHITASETVAKTVQESRWLGLLSLMASYTPAHAIATEEKK